MQGDVIPGPRLSRVRPAPGRVRKPTPRPDRRSPSLKHPHRSKDVRPVELLGSPKKGSQEVGWNNTFFHIRNSAISNLRIWSNNKQPALGLKRAGRSSKLSLSLSPLYPSQFSEINLYLHVFPYSIKTFACTKSLEPTLLRQAW